MIEDILDVLGHDRVHLRDILCKLGHVALRSGVQVKLLGFLNERVCHNTAVRISSTS